METGDPPSYGITEGGPLWRAQRRLHLAQDQRGDLARRIGFVVVVAYVPLLAAGIRWQHLTGAWSPAMRELTTHVRALILLPLLLIAEVLIEERSRGAGSYLVRSRIVGDDCIEALRSVLARTTRLRDSSLIEGVFFVGATISLFVLPGFTREPERTIVWSLQPSILLYRFLALRILWRWALWALYLVRLSRLPLGLRATHPDRAAGLSPLVHPSTMFALVVMAGAAAIAATWGDMMRFEHYHATAFSQEAVAYLIAALLLTACPLWVFTGPLVRIRHEGERAYGALANRYSDAFEHRWLHRAGDDPISPGAAALGSSDFQSLNDLGGSFERMESMTPVLITRVMALAVTVAVVLPLLPLAIAEVGAFTLLKRLAAALL